MDLIDKTEISLSFSFYGRYLVNGDYFVVQISTDNGDSFQTVKQYNYGVEIPQSYAYFDDKLFVAEPSVVSMYFL